MPLSSFSSQTTFEIANEPVQGVPVEDPDAEQEEDSPGEATPSFKVKAKAILLTYNELPENMTIDRLLEALHNSGFIDKTLRWSICLEQGSRVHAHAYFEAKKQYDCLLNHFKLIIPPGDAHNGDYESIPSDCQSNSKTGSSFRPAANQGHFYVQCRYKNTHIAKRNNYGAGKEFSVKTDWVQKLWQQQKIHDDQVLACAGYYRCCTAAFESLVRFSCNKRRVEMKAEKRKERVATLNAMKTPHKQYPRIDDWLEQYKEVAFRYNFLILWGPSKMGKTELARSYFQNPFEHRDAVCWAGYDEDKHDVIIFDDVKMIYKYISENRALFRAGGLATVQTSATNMHAMDVDVTQKPIIVTTNERPIERATWIEANSVQLEIYED